LRGAASGFDQLDGLLVERKEGFGAKPAAFIGNHTVGEIAAGIKARQSRFRVGRFTTTLLLLRRARIVSAISRSETL
jgi:hypothetical protein